MFIPLVLGQVNFSIDQVEDLLALDSLHDEVGITIYSSGKKLTRFVFHVSFQHPILPPPPSFVKVGARMVTEPRAPAGQSQGAVRGPQQPAIAAGKVFTSGS